MNTELTFAKWPEAQLVSAAPKWAKKTVIAGLTLIVMSADVKRPISATLGVGSILHLEVQTI